LALLTLAVLVTAKSATGLMVTVTVELLLLGVGSVVPTGLLTLATLATLPLTLAATLTWKLMVARAPLAKVALPLIVLPATLALVIPVVVTTLVMVPKPVGRVSVQLAPVTALGPLLAMTMV
jgi:hypothetical protein